jgi:hypothetical protein
MRFIMKGKLVTPFLSVLFATALPLSIAAVVQEPGRPAYPPPVQKSQPRDQNPNKDQSDVKTFSGKITKSNGKYVLEDSKMSSSYYLDDAKSARKYDGKAVLVTGTLDAASNTIHVQRIEAAA